MPDVVFRELDGASPDAARLDATADGDATADATSSTCPDKAPADAICCGAKVCVGCTIDSCAACSSKACSATEVCCQKGQGNQSVQCRAPGDCK